MAFLHLQEGEAFVFTSQGDETHAHRVECGSIDWSHCDLNQFMGYIEVTIDWDSTIQAYLESDDQLDLCIERSGKCFSFKQLDVVVDTEIDYKMRLKGTYQK